MEQQAQASPNPNPPDDLTLLRDVKRGDVRVLSDKIGAGQSASQALREAEHILNTGFLASTGKGGKPYGLATYTIEDIATVTALIQNARDVVERPFVLAGQSLEAYMDELASQGTL